MMSTNQVNVVFDVHSGVEDCALETYMGRYQAKQERQENLKFSLILVCSRQTHVVLHKVPMEVAHGPCCTRTNFGGRRQIKPDLSHTDYS